MNFKELYKIAKESLEELSPLDEADFRLEQAEYNDHDETWDIVVSYLVENINKPDSPLGALSTGFKYQYHRVYKKVKIDKNKNVKGFYMFEKV
ncbi:hypothetical protein [Marivirga sp.]|uniref:hypothetical protein n=1 Tax=Marivirga sp. TaxID=2018662 RepID=UPI003DA74EE4